MHGVAVLGTIITEWDAGRAIMEQLLRHPDKMAAFVEKCGQIAEHHGFQVETYKTHLVDYREIKVFFGRTRRSSESLFLKFQ